MAVQPWLFHLDSVKGTSAHPGQDHVSLHCLHSSELNFSLHICPLSQVVLQSSVFLKITIRTCTGRRQAWTAVIKCLAQRQPWKTSEKQFLQWAELSVVSLAPNFVCRGEIHLQEECMWAPRQPGIVWLGGQGSGQIKFTRLRTVSSGRKACR